MPDEKPENISFILFVEYTKTIQHLLTKLQVVLKSLFSVNKLIAEKAIIVHRTLCHDVSTVLCWSEKRTHNTLWDFILYGLHRLDSTDKTLIK